MGMQSLNYAKDHVDPLLLVLRHKLYPFYVENELLLLIAYLQLNQPMELEKVPRLRLPSTHTKLLQFAKT